MFGLSALSFSTLCAACANEVYQPAPIPPAVETVTVYRELPDTLLAPCQKVPVRPEVVTTDVDLMGLLNRALDALDRCADQVDAIRNVYRSADRADQTAEGN
jgi:hypothetical protein